MSGGVKKQTVSLVFDTSNIGRACSKKKYISMNRKHGKRVRWGEGMHYNATLTGNLGHTHI